METQEQPTTGNSDASPLDRIEAMLSADDAPNESTKPLETEAPQADPPATVDAEQADEPKQESETPNEYQLSDVAKLLGADESALDVDEDGNITVKTKIDGQEGKAKFADLLKSYQLQGHVDKQVREVAEARKAVQEQSQAMQQQMQVQQAVIEKLAEVKAIETTLAQYQEINWNALWDSDPVQAGKLGQQMRVLQEQHAQKSNEVNQAGQQFRQQQQQQSAASLQNERQALLKAVPEWSDEVTAAKDRANITADLQARGYTSADIQNLTDHKAVLLARDAWLYRQQQSVKSATEKQVRAAPKIIKPGSSQASNRSMNAIQTLRNEVRTTGSRQSVMDYLLKTGKV